MSVLPFQPHRFQNAAEHYVAGRVPYAPRLIARVAGFTGLNRAHRVLDLGCGPGPLAKAFAPLVAGVLAVDPEPEMLRIAAVDAPANIEWREGSSYDITPDWGRFQLVAMGRSFHWMDRVDTLHRLEALVPPGGAVALFHDTHPDMPENAWWQKYRALVRRYEAGTSAHRDHGYAPHEAVLLDSAFSQLERHAVIERRRASVASVIARALSKSSIAMAGAPAPLGAEIESLLAPYAQDGEVTEIVATEALLGFRAG